MGHFTCSHASPSSSPSYSPFRPTIGFPSQFNINSIQIDFQIIQFCANLYAHLKVYFNLQVRRFNFNNCSSDLVH